MTFLKIMAVAAVALFTVALANSAEARGHKRHHQHRHHHYQHKPIRTDRTPTFTINTRQSHARVQRRHSRVSYSGGEIVGHPQGCPRSAFCGCGVSVKVFGHTVRNLFLASNWFKFPRAAPGPGMVAVRNHHVMYIVAYDGNGNATVYDPNSGGHQTRIHTRSLAGYAIVNPHA